MENLERVPLGVNTAIINVLQKYNKKIPIDFVAKTIGRRAPEIRTYVENLEQEGIIEREGENISIAADNFDSD